MVTIYIDNKAYAVQAGENLLKAALGLGLDLPYFCWHPEMGSLGACRQCAIVQYQNSQDQNSQDSHGRVVMGCMTAATEGARFSMLAEPARQFRKNLLESLMLNHPHDCPVCAEGGECHLQDMTVMIGHRDRRYRGKKNTHRNQYLGPLLHHEMNRCIICYRCTRYYNDYAGGTDLSAQAAHDHVYFGRHEDGVLESPFAGNLVEVCPTGVFTDKPLAHDYTRKWDMQSAPSICTACAVGCNTLPGERYGKLKRIHNRYNHQVNGYFLCDRGRYGGSYSNDPERIKFAALRNTEGRYDAIENSLAIETMAQWLKASKNIAAIGSPRASLESNYLLRRLVGEENYCNGMADYESQLIHRVSEILRNGSVITPSIRQIEAADTVLVLGEDVTNTAPRMALALRQAVRNKAKKLAEEKHIPLWQDEAVRNLAQDQLSPLFSVAMSHTPLDDVAEATLTLRPADIARFGYAIAAELDVSLAAVDGLDNQTVQMVKRIAQTLKEAANPLIISGSGCQSLDVVEAASAVAHALPQQGKMLSYCLAECNSLGSSLLTGDNLLAGANNESTKQVSLHSLCQRAAAGQIDTLIVLENDLYRRAPADQIDALFKHVSRIVVLDCNDSATMSRSSLALPTATSFEAEGTLVSSEGRAQRHFPAYLPGEQRRASWQWLAHLGRVIGSNGFDELVRFDQITAACAADHPALAKIVTSSPPAKFRDHGLKIPRQTHRYSGRTAMLADVSIHEPKQPEDEDSSLAFSMEGSNSPQKPGALLPYVWSPGWNSNQSLHKFQSEAGGALTGGTAGVRLIEPTAGNAVPERKMAHSAPGNTAERELLPLYRVFGSEELSARSPAIAELIAPATIQFAVDDAAQLGIASGDKVLVTLAASNQTWVAEINNSIPRGCAAYVVGLPNTAWIAPASTVTVSREADDANDQPTTTDSGGNNALRGNNA